MKETNLSIVLLQNHYPDTNVAIRSQPGAGTLPFADECAVPKVFGTNFVGLHDYTPGFVLQLLPEEPSSTTSRQSKTEES